VSTDGAEQLVFHRPQEVRMVTLCPGQLSSTRFSVRFLPQQLVFQLGATGRTRWCQQLFAEWQQKALP
jgi:hypothetical protein